MVGKGKLKAIALARLKPGMHSDGAGLYLDVQESGSRSWILRVGVRGKRRTIGLGGLSNVSLADARDAAAELRAKARKGEDVLETRRAKRQAEERKSSIPTFERAANTVHANLVKTFESETHSYNWLQSLKTYVFPVFGTKTVDKIDSADILTAIGPIWNTVPDTAGRTLRRIKAVFDYCQVAGHRTLSVNGMSVTMPNPCDGIRKALPKPNRAETHHEALPYPELPAFIQKLRVCQSALSVKLALEFLVLTCSRTGEALGAKWEEFDMERRIWTVPAARMKMKKPHVVPLSDRCIEILQLAKQFNDGAVVFPGRYAGHPLSDTALLMAVRRMGLEVVPHGFRATFKTWAEEKTKFDTLVIEASMAHAVKGIERHYLRTTFFEMRKELMEAWAVFAMAHPRTE